MQDLIEKYENKLVAAGLMDTGTPLLAGLDADLQWNRNDPACNILTEVITSLGVNALLYGPPAEPYRTILESLCDSPVTAITPQDCETRTFMHDIPILRQMHAPDIIAALRRRKTVYIAGHGIVTWGAVSPEQAFIFYSSVCFAALVKFFADIWTDTRTGRVTPAQQATFTRVVERLPALASEPPPLMTGPFTQEDQVYAALVEAGRYTVEYGLVDSFFGNLSYRFDNRLYISQTASSLDELTGCIDACPLDGSSCAGLTASSELTAHQGVLEQTGVQALLHGHPKFSVICSLLCDRTDCDRVGQCHILCPHPRQIGDIPIVPGEVGTGPHGLCHTLPPALQGRRGAIVYGHGLFTTGQVDFNEAFAGLLEIEQMCLDHYMSQL